MGSSASVAANATAIAMRFPKSTRSGHGYRATGICHGGKSLSVSISDGRNGVLMRCFAGCELSRIAASIGLHVSDLFQQKAQRTQRFLPVPTAHDIRRALASEVDRLRADRGINEHARLFTRELNDVRSRVSAILRVDLQPLPPTSADGSYGGNERDSLWPVVLERSWREVWIESTGMEPPCAVDFHAGIGDGVDRFILAEDRAANVMYEIAKQSK